MPVMPDRDATLAAFDASRDFYVALGWQVIYDADDLRVMELADRRFYLQKYYNRAWCNNSMLHVSVQSVDAYFTSGSLPAF